LREVTAAASRVVTELVLNHTSDQHPWFHARGARRPAASNADFYVWSDTPRSTAKLGSSSKTSSIRLDWDHQRSLLLAPIYSHQPESQLRPIRRLKRALMRVSTSGWGWASTGLRLRRGCRTSMSGEGTTCREPAETHAFLTSYDGTSTVSTKQMLLAEANQWPEDAVAYFDHGKLHRPFIFRSARLFMSYEPGSVSADRYLGADPDVFPIRAMGSFLAKTTTAHAGDGHDESATTCNALTRKKTGCASNSASRRRTRAAARQHPAHHRALECALFSAPRNTGLYYGDEIGMGDNVYLGDR